MSVVLLERHDAVLLVRLNRPERMNAIDQSLHDGLSAAWHAAAAPDVRAVVLTGEGRGFCAGADLQEVRDAQNVALQSLRHTYHPHVLSMATLDKPVIAAVNGAAAGAGLSLACGADIRLASTAARFVPAFVDIGLVPDAGGSFYIHRLLGYARAFAWLATGERWSAEQALAAGLVTEVLAPEELLPRALALAEQLASQPGVAVGLTKRLLTRAARASLAEQLESEAEMQDLAVADPGRAEARARKMAQLKR